MTQPMTPTERNALIRLIKARAKQAERDAEAREKTLIGRGARSDDRRIRSPRQNFGMRQW
jgi:hypothetical protein